MIIDSHAHILERSWLPDKWWKWLDTYDNPAEKSIAGIFNHRKGNRISDLWDPTGEKLIASMDRAGIAKSVVLPLDFGLHLGEPETDIFTQNILIGKIAEKHAPRIIPFAGVDPRRPEALDILTHGIRHLGMKGLKLYPGTGFHLNETPCLKIFEKARQFDIPVIVHTGCTFGPLLSRYCQPLEIDEIVSTFPGIRIVGAHMGGGWFESLCWLGYANSGIYTDISLVQARCKQDPNEFAGMIRKALDMLGADNVLFGTDWPFTDRVMAPADYIQRIQTLVNPTDIGPVFIKEEIRNILYKNTKTLLKLTDKEM